MKMAAPLIQRLMKNDLAGAAAELEQNDYLVSPQNAAAKEKMKALFGTNLQNLAPRRLENSGGPIADRLGELKVPTLIIVGEDDHPDNARQSQVAHEKIPGSVLVTMKHAGHLAYVEHPQEFADLVMNFLK